MHRIRRPVAVMSAILFQLMLVVGVYGCVALGDAQVGAAVSMPGMSMPAGDEMAPAGAPAPLALTMLELLVPASVSLVPALPPSRA